LEFKVLSLKFKEFLTHFQLFIPVLKKMHCYIKISKLKLIDIFDNYSLNFEL